MAIGATFSPTWQSFIIFRALLSFFAAAPPVVGLSIIRDIFFFHERAQKVAVWAVSISLGPIIGQLISSFLLPAISWRWNMGILSIFYGISTILVIVFGRETLYDRGAVVEAGASSSRIHMLLGISGARTKHRPSILSVSKHLIQIVIRPQLILPSIFLTILSTFSDALSTSTTPGQTTIEYRLIVIVPLVTTLLSLVYIIPTNQYLYTRHVTTHRGLHEPESRLWALYPAVFLSITSLLLCGEYLQRSLSLVILAVSMGIGGFAWVVATTAIVVFMLDCFPQHAGSVEGWLLFFGNMGMFSKTYYFTTWLSSGPAKVYGIEAGILFASFLGCIVTTQIWGRRWRSSWAAVGC